MGPLAGIKVVERAGIGPAPFCGMLLADYGAEVLLIERKTKNPNAAAINDEAMGENAFWRRGKRSIQLDLKQPVSAGIALDLIGKSDVLIEGFRPGVMESLGLSPDICLQINPALVYGRLTGWGQTGPLSSAAGHDINYIALSGALHYSGHAGEVPFTPATLLGDVGGGALVMAVGIISALLHAKLSGVGQVVDGAISDGSAYMTTLLWSMLSSELLNQERGNSFVTGDSPWYDCYECSDGGYITVGALEPEFYEQLIEQCGLSNDTDFADQYDAKKWPSAKKKMQALFKTKCRSEWCQILEGSDVCFAPALSFKEAAEHPHNKERGCFIRSNGKIQPGPAPKFSATATEVGDIPKPGDDSERILTDLGYSVERVRSLSAKDII